MYDDLALEDLDEELAAALRGERRRQEQYVELIASENYVSPRVLQAQASLLTNKYADGYPGRRHYSGCEYADVAESLAIERAQRLFGAGYANVQPYSGSGANFAAFLAMVEPGDTVLAMSSAQGGHRTHGAGDSLSGKLYDIVSYGVDPGTGEIDYDQAAELARRHRPKLIVAGFSAYSRTLDWRRFRTIADEVGALLLADMAHVAGLVAAGLSPNPVPLADLTTTTTHKTLRGPRGGMILAPKPSALTERVDAAVFPATQGGPLMHVIAAKAVAFQEALQPEFKTYQERVLTNARLMARCLLERGFKIVSGGTDNHMLLIDLAGRDPDACAERALERAHIAVNRMAVPSDSPGAMAHSATGLRAGTPAVTTRGFGDAEIRMLSGWVADVLDAGEADTVVDRIRAAVLELTAEFPVYSQRS